MSVFACLLTIFYVINSKNNGIINIDEHARKFHIRFSSLINNITSKYENMRRRGLTLPSTLEKSDRQAILDAHNDYRRDIAKGNVAGHPSATNMNEMFYDLALESVSTQWAIDTCAGGFTGLTHNGGRSSDLKLYEDQAAYDFPSQGNIYVGENLWWSSSRGTSQVSSFVSGIGAWYNEVNNYDYDTNSKDPPGSVIGHYTQVVWAKSRFVGCGFVVNDPCGSWFGCNYAPGGNNGGQPYESGEVCSNCDADRPLCDDGLCGGCMNKAFLVDNTQTEPNLCDNGVGERKLKSPLIGNHGKSLLIVLLVVLAFIILLAVLAYFGVFGMIQNKCCDKTALVTKKNKSGFVNINGLSNQKFIHDKNINSKGNKSKIETHAFKLISLSSNNKSSNAGKTKKSNTKKKTNSKKNNNSKKKNNTKKKSSWKKTSNNV